MDAAACRRRSFVLGVRVSFGGAAQRRAARSNPVIVAVPLGPHRLLESQYSPNLRQARPAKVADRMAAATLSRLSQLDDERLARLVHQRRRGRVRGPLRPPPRVAAGVLPPHGRQPRGRRGRAAADVPARPPRAAVPPATGRVRPWLFAIARNRCRTLIAARRDAAVPVDELEPSYDGLAEDVARRADLRELVADLARLPRGPARRARPVRARRPGPGADRRA